jgi:hypothetical protein
VFFGLPYCLRVALTGIWLMRTGEIEANLLRLSEVLPDVASSIDAHAPELVERKVAGGERARLASGELDSWTKRLELLGSILEGERDQSALPQEPSANLRRALNELVVEARTRSSALWHADGSESS